MSTTKLTHLKRTAGAHILHPSVLLKRKSAVAVRKQKFSSQMQFQRTELFLKHAQAQAVANFLLSTKFFVCFRFVESPTFTLSNLQSVCQLEKFNLLSVKEYETCQHISTIIEAKATWLPKYLAQGAVFLVGTDDETSYLTFLKKSIKLEGEVSALFSLLFAKESDIWVDLNCDSQTNQAARKFYETWDSRESILLELAATLSATPGKLIASLQSELIAGTALSVPQITILPPYFK